ncbi:MAG: hypothetical protein ACOCSK_00490 [Rhodothermales bacterium]
MQRSVFLVILGVLLFTGCRSYGGFDSRDELYTQLQRASAEFERELLEAQRLSDELAERALAHPEYERISQDLGTIIALHEAMLAENRSTIEELSENSPYRSLARAYGAVISDQDVLRRMLQQTTEVIDGAAELDVTPRPIVSPYSVVPVFYHRAAAVDIRSAYSENGDKVATSDELEAE